MTITVGDFIVERLHRWGVRRKMADVLTFVRNAWANAAGPVTPRDVETVRNALHK